MLPEDRGPPQIPHPKEVCVPEELVRFVEETATKCCVNSCCSTKFSCPLVEAGVPNTKPRREGPSILSFESGVE